nr:hypothetical protein CFP56_70012 [Quercus suber]
MCLQLVSEPPDLIAQLSEAPNAFCFCVCFCSRLGGCVCPSLTKIPRHPADYAAPAPGRVTKASKLNSPGLDLPPLQYFSHNTRAHDHPPASPVLLHPNPVTTGKSMRCPLPSHGSRHGSWPAGFAAHDRAEEAVHPRVFEGRNRNRKSCPLRTSPPRSGAYGVDGITVQGRSVSGNEVKQLTRLRNKADCSRGEAMRRRPCRDQSTRTAGVLLAYLDAIRHQVDRV